MPDPVLLEQKRALRRAVRAAAAGFYPQHGAAYSRRLLGRLLSLPEYQTCLTLFCFVGTGCEADTLPLIRHALQSGRRVAVPLCTGPGRMEARLVPDLSALASRGAYGIPEPAADAPLLDKEAIDFAVVPCLSFDRRGRRLGQGGGYYDRLLPQLACPTCLICRERLMSEAVPTEEHDRRCTLYVTERGVMEPEA